MQFQKHQQHLLQPQVASLMAIYRQVSFPYSLSCLNHSWASNALLWLQKNAIEAMWDFPPTCQREWHKHTENRFISADCPCLCLYLKLVRFPCFFFPFIWHNRPTSKACSSGGHLFIWASGKSCFESFSSFKCRFVATLKCHQGHVGFPISENGKGRK